MKEFDNDINSIVFRFGKFGYSADRICKLLMLDSNQKIQFMAMFDNPEHDLRRSYDKGVAIGEMKTDIILDKLLKNGDVMAIMEQGKRKYYREIKDLKRDLFDI